MTATPPVRDLTAECEVLGSAMIRPALMAELDLDPVDFSSRRHGVIWSAMRAVHERGLVLDIASVREVLIASGTWETAGSWKGLSEAWQHEGVSINAPWYARKVKRLAIQRKMQTAQAMLGASLAEDDLSTPDHDELGATLARLASMRDDAAALIVDAKPPSWFDDVNATIEAATHPSIVPLVPLGLSLLDDHIGGGAEPGWLVVLMGSAKSGKSAFALNNTARMACKAGKRVLVVSLEMSRRDCIRRFLASESNVPVRAQRRGDLTPGQQCQLVNAGDEVVRWHVEILTCLRTVEEIASAARRHAKDSGLDLLVVDYAQLVDNGLENLVADIAKTTRGLKLLAGELQCVVMLLSQPNNADAKSGEVGLFSGKGSGSIAADCDMMLVPRRDSSDPTRAGLDLAGFRHGESHRWGLGALRFDGGRMLFCVSGS